MIMLKFLARASLAIALVLGVFPATGLQAQTFQKPTLSVKPSLDGMLDNQPSKQGLSQVTSVSELQDIKPTDWAYEALKSLVERYGCIVGYPDRTFRGDRALSRWEFAAGLNACMNTMERLLQENVAVLREDLDKLKALAKSFEQELANLETRIDNLENRTAYLEDHTFSTTTKLTGEVVIGRAGVLTGQRKEGTEDISRNPTLGYRTRLELNTSFTGEDLLFTRLATGNMSEFIEETETYQSTLSFAQPQNNQMGIEQLYYRFPLTENIKVWIDGAGGSFDDFWDVLNVLDGDGGSGALSRFGTRSPIYYGVSGAGGGFQSQWGDFQLAAAYLAPNAGSPNQGEGLFNGTYGAIAQIGYVPDPGKTGVMFIYRNGYNSLDTFTGSQRSNFQLFTETELGQAVPTSNNSYGLEFSWQLADQFVLGGWGGYTNARPLTSLDGQINQGTLDIWNWAVTLAFPDAFKEGNMAGIIVGMQPWVASSNITFANGLSATDRDASLHLETFYEYAINDNMNITPGIIVITNPNNDARNSTLVIGTIRTTFTF
ncbi:MAG: iron uptake porin [Microcystaceae cyanobacterium]